MRSSPNRLSFVRLGDESLPFARRELFRTLAAQLSQPSGEIQLTSLPDFPVTRPSSVHTERRVLAEPFKDNKIQGTGQFFFSEKSAREQFILNVVPRTRFQVSREIPHRN